MKSISVLPSDLPPVPSPHPRSETGFGHLPLAYVDLEFTGLEPRIHDITEIAVLKPAWAWGAPELHPTCEPLPGWLAWTVKVWPRNLSTASPEALQINGFDEAVWRREAIGLSDAMRHLRHVLLETTLVGHNAFLDLSFIREGFHRCPLVPFLDIKYRLDTATLIWEHLVPLGLERGSLANACTVCDISNAGAHRALADAVRCKLLVDALLFDEVDDEEVNLRRQRIRDLQRGKVLSSG